LRQSSLNGHGQGGILVVEDDPDIRDTFREVLEAEGYRVSTAANGQEGLERLEEIHKPCLVLLDLMMPVMSGPEFLEAMRQRDGLGPVPVVIVSAWPDEAEKTQGAQGFMAKPVNLDRLLALVHHYCTS
jgi:CheY-like chemotaxis protein